MCHYAGVYGVCSAGLMTATAYQQEVTPLQKPHPLSSGGITLEPWDIIILDFMPQLYIVSRASRIFPRMRMLASYRRPLKGNVAAYKDLNLVTVTIKDISHVSTVKECNYRSVALALIRSFAVVRAVLTYVYWLSVLAGSVSTD